MKRLAADAGQPVWRDLLKNWGVVATWMVVISTLSSEGFSADNTNRYLDPILRYFFPQLSPAGFVLAHGVIRKLAHIVEFFVLGLLAYWAARRGRAPRWRFGWAAQAMSLAAGFALIDETHQMFIPNRTGSYVDSAIDCSGAFASQVVIFLRRRNRGSPTRPPLP